MQNGMLAYVHEPKPQDSEENTGRNFEVTPKKKKKKDNRNIIKNKTLLLSESKRQNRTHSRPPNPYLIRNFYVEYINLKTLPCIKRTMLQIG